MSDSESCETITFRIKNNFSEDFEYKKKAYINAEKNLLFVETLYDEFFRPVIKYGNDERKVEIYQELWDQIRADLYNE